MKFLVIVSVFLSYLMCVRYSELDPDARPAVEKELSYFKSPQHSQYRPPAFTLKPLDEAR